MQLTCKVKHINSLTYGKSYEVILSHYISESFSVTIIDDFENETLYLTEYFMTPDELRDFKIENILMIKGDI